MVHRGSVYAAVNLRQTQPPVDSGTFAPLISPQDLVKAKALNSLLTRRQHRGKFRRKKARGFSVTKARYATGPKEHRKKGWFKRLLERIAKANQESGGQICSA
jgi:hypothetical protein